MNCTPDILYFVNYVNLNNVNSKKKELKMGFIHNIIDAY